MKLEVVTAKQRSVQCDWIVVGRLGMRGSSAWPVLMITRSRGRHKKDGFGRRNEGVRLTLNG